MVKMAVQAPFYPENMDFPMCGLQDPAFGFVDDLRFSLQYPQQTLFHLQRSAQKLGVDYNEGVSSASSCNSLPPMPVFQSLDALFALQSQEIDRILQIQNERLRLVLQEQRKQDIAVLLSDFESKTSNLIRRKEEDLAQATMRTMELQECLRKAEMERETWQRLAKANEAMVTDLNNTLEQVRERVVSVSHTAEDTASFCGSCERDDRGQEEAVKRSSRKMTCKSCYSRSPCVLFLPCRHVCSCKYCEAFLGSCPVCSAVKEGSIEVFFV
ncbi:BOI-related E3 ubiquitin-protein ligase 1-like [Corylus avellana]|uniref:BOI-related E3 ubiquitin-protein ligase 1-like n=1 Tax=Corylus avellana TaxID=13451 RepID=UPI00286C1D5E|nr:BOI-related E3 ubiquitin-protein ligase 1-like [Corylus avellana]